MPKVSIIIPVYNVEKYLKQCLDSVINQTLQDIEIICIDDCSTDNSLKILKEYALKDNRIKIIEQKFNQGQGVARNEALKIATGEYIGFVDPDDWIEPNMYEEMYNKAKEFNTDYVICNFEKFYNDSSYIKHFNTLEKITKINNYIQSNIVYNFDNLHKYFLESANNYAWCRIYKRDFISKYSIRFVPIKRCEDILFCCLAKLLARRIIHIDKEFYHYRIHRKVNFIKNKHHDILCLSLINEIYKYNPDDDLKCGILNFLEELCKREYQPLSLTDKKNLYNESKKYLPYISFIKFRKFVIIFTLKQIIRTIFSIRNSLENGAIYKYLYILGFKIKLKKKENNE